MKPEFTIEQIREFVSKGYTSVSARYVKSALQHYDEQLNKKHCTCSDEKSTIPHYRGYLYCKAFNEG